jgi:LysM repeat protein
MDRQMRLLRFCLIATVVVAAFLGAGPVLAAATPAVQEQDQIVHVVQQGENLFRLALRYGVTVEAIMAANGLTDEHKIDVGQRLIIPDETATPASAAAAATTGGTYVVQPGDTLIGIALRYGVALWELMHTNGVFGSYRIYPGQGLVIPGAGGAPPEPVPETSTTYVVRPGDTLTQIARRFNTTAFALAHSNGIADPSAIRVGQVLRVPRAASGSPAPSGGRQRILINLSEPKQDPQCVRCHVGHLDAQLAWHLLGGFHRERHSRLADHVERPDAVGGLPREPHFLRLHCAWHLRGAASLRMGRDRHAGFHPLLGNAAFC